MRDSAETFANIIQIMIYICLIPAVPFLIGDKFWKISLALDNLQFIYILTFTNVRPSINGLKVFDQLDIFRSFNFPNLIYVLESPKNEDYKFVTVYQEFYKNIEPILLVYGIFFMTHIFLRLFALCITNNNYKYKLLDFIKEFFEYRFHIDYWQMVMSILAIFAYIKFIYFDDTYSAFFAMFVGLMLFLSPFFCFYQLYLWREKSKDIPRNEIGQLMFPWNQFAERKGYMYKNMWQFINVEKRFAIFYIVIFLTRKLIYAFVIITLNEDLIIVISSLLGMNFIILLLLIIRRPFKQSIDNFRTIFSELTQFAAIIQIYFLEDDTSENEQSRFDKTTQLLFCFGISIFFNATLTVGELFFMIYQKLFVKYTPVPKFEGDQAAAKKQKNVKVQAIRVLPGAIDGLSDLDQQDLINNKIEGLAVTQLKDGTIQIQEQQVVGQKKELTEQQKLINKQLFEMQADNYKKQNQQQPAWLRTVNTNKKTKNYLPASNKKIQFDLQDSPIISPTNSEKRNSARFISEKKSILINSSRFINNQDNSDMNQSNINRNTKSNNNNNSIIIRDPEFYDLQDQKVTKKKQKKSKKNLLNDDFFLDNNSLVKSQFALNNQQDIQTEETPYISSARQDQKRKTNLSHISRFKKKYNK